jgi:magnesium chelatase family protein
MDPAGASLLAAKVRAGYLSARGLHKVSQVARTVADLQGEEQVGQDHVAEAISLRAGRATLVG